MRVISEFVSPVNIKNVDIQNKNHHEQTKACQKLFFNDVNTLVRVFDEMGNPFDEQSEDLLRLHTKEIMNSESVEFLTKIEQLGNSQYDTFVQERLIMKTRPLTAPIKRNHVVLFNTHGRFAKKKTTDPVSLLKSESSLFSRLYVACQTRNGDLDAFFSHENHPFPPSLSTYGELRLGKKSDLMECLEKNAPGKQTLRPHTDVTIMDGAVLVNYGSQKDARHLVITQKSIHFLCCERIHSSTTDRYCVGSIFRKQPKENHSR